MKVAEDPFENSIIDAYLTLPDGGVSSYMDIYNLVQLPAGKKPMDVRKIVERMGAEGILIEHPSEHRKYKNFSLNTKTSKEELPILVNGIQSIVPITKSGQTASGKNIIFLFNGYNSPETFVSYFSKNDQVKVQIANTNFVEYFDVSSIKAVFKGAMELCLE